MFVNTKRRTIKGMDRPNLRLGPIDEMMIGAVAALQPNTIVALTTTGALDTTKWLAGVRAVVLGFMPGEAAGVCVCVCVCACVRACRCD
jgi:3-oxoacyl-(acyl-carrier-protein) synthase